MDKKRTIISAIVMLACFVSAAILFNLPPKRSGSSIALFDKTTGEHISLGMEQFEIEQVVGEPIIVHKGGIYQYKDISVTYKNKKNEIYSVKFEINKEHTQRFKNNAGLQLNSSTEMLRKIYKPELKIASQSSGIVENNMCGFLMKLNSNPDYDLIYSLNPSIRENNQKYYLHFILNSSFQDSKIERIQLIDLDEME